MTLSWASTLFLVLNGFVWSPNGLSLLLEIGVLLTSLILFALHFRLYDPWADPYKVDVLKKLHLVVQLVLLGITFLLHSHG